MRVGSRSAQEIEPALRSTGGFISQAARKLSMTHRGLNKRIAADHKLQEVLHDIREEYLDLAESQLMKLVQEGNLGAIRFFLKCKGRDRGWGERQDLNAQVNSSEELPPVLVVNFLGVKDGRPPDESHKTIDGRQLAKG